MSYQIKTKWGLLVWQRSLDQFLHDVSQVLLDEVLFTLKEIGCNEIKSIDLNFVPFPASHLKSYENTLEEVVGAEDSFFFLALWSETHLIKSVAK